MERWWQGFCCSCTTASESYYVGSKVRFPLSKSQQEDRQDLEGREEGEGKLEGCWLCREPCLGKKGHQGVRKESHASDTQPDTHPPEPVRRDNSCEVPATAF